MKRRLVIFLLFSFLYGVIYGQITKGLLTSEQEFIYKALDSVLFIIRQDYVIKDTSRINPTEYGFEKNEYFGRLYTFAILSDNKLWCDAKIRTPWVHDSNYQQLGKIDSIRPVLSKTAIRPFNQRQFHTFLIDQKTPLTHYDSLLNNFSVASITAQNKEKGVSISQATLDSTGWLVIAYSTLNMSKNDTNEIKLLIYRSQLAFKSNESEVKIKAPSVEKNILGGFYFTVKYSVGRIELLLSGLLHQKKDTWILSAIPIENLLKKGKSSLTPIKRSEDSNQSPPTKTGKKQSKL